MTRRRDDDRNLMYDPGDYGPNGEQVADWLTRLHSLSGPELTAFQQRWLPLYVQDKHPAAETDADHPGREEDDEAPQFRDALRALKDLADALDTAGGYGYCGGMDAASRDAAGAIYDARSALFAGREQADEDTSAIGAALSVATFSRVLVVRWELDEDYFDLLTEPWLETCGALPEGGENS